MNREVLLHLLGFHENAESESESDSGNSDNLDDVERAPANRGLRAQRAHLREEIDPFACEPEYFRKHFRMSKDLARELLNLIRHEFDVSERSSHIPVEIELCIGLRMYATGGYQKLVGHDFFNASCQSVVSRIMDRFTDCLIHLADQFIYFPQSREEREEVQEGFLRFTRIPGILGLIDGTIIKFLRPSENEEAFYNHKHAHSMNVQLISDHNFLIRNVRICPGSNTDQNVWNHSDVKQYLEDLRGNEGILLNERPYYLLGDNGYTPSPIMLTPMRRTVPGTPEALYTREVCKTRCREEILNAKLVNKWRILKRERAMRYSPIKVANIITASAVLHNYIILNGEIPNRQPREPQLQQNVNLPFDNAAGERERNYIIRRYFVV